MHQKLFRVSMLAVCVVAAIVKAEDTVGADHANVKSPTNIKSANIAVARISSMAVSAGDTADPGEITVKDVDAIKFPDTYDLSSTYEKCKLIENAYAHSNCESPSWALATTSALSDYICITSNNTRSIPLSAEHLLTCCSECSVRFGGGCNGGDALIAWLHLRRKGVPTGGPYGSEVGCKPYSFVPTNNGSVDPISPLTCSGDRCTNSYFKTPYAENLFFAKSYYLIVAPLMEKKKFLGYQEKFMQYAIYTRGPIVAQMQLFEDFKHYQSGVYEHLWGAQIGTQYVKIIGWGVYNTTDAYWLCVNPVELGQKSGVFMIRRGNDECGIETLQVTAGFFDVERSSKLTDFKYDRSMASSLRTDAVTLISTISLFVLHTILSRGH